MNVYASLLTMTQSHAATPALSTDNLINIFYGTLKTLIALASLALSMASFLQQRHAFARFIHGTQRHELPL